MSRAFPFFLLFILLVAGCTAAGAPMRPDELQWWWSNEEPPEIVLSGPAGPVRSEVSVQVSLRPSGRVELIEAALDDRPLELRTPIALDTTSLPDGRHSLRVIAEDRSRRRNRSEASITLLSDNTPPTLSVEMQPPALSQGTAAVVRLRANEPTAVEAAADDQPLSLRMGNGYAWTILSFGPDATIGPRSLAITGRDEAGNVARTQSVVAVSPSSFVAENVQVPVALARLLMPEFRQQEESILGALYAQVSGPPLWNGKFRVPSDGQIVTEYGTQRAYNGGPMVGHHAGIDIAAPGGAPVLASQAGRVVLIDELTVRGKTLVIDHGLGVYTTYAHLQEILVAPDAVVEAGQRVARVGNTGLSTGPHLHWEVWVAGVTVNPIAWTKLDLP